MRLRRGTQVRRVRRRRPNIESKRVNVDFPAWMVTGLDRQAKRLGITRQALFKMWIAEHLE
ncbi:type II toxin-antitoxin system BrnA family antitoxin [Pelagibacterium halotolerans]|uniref:type II toxin-antitoxin system BrnA family antitoxin n=1 Tax=Pelagibacterium halotolerans TaxID=531813 RepID=UPI0038516686